MFSFNANNNDADQPWSASLLFDYHALSKCLRFHQEGVTEQSDLNSDLSTV